MKIIKPFLVMILFIELVTSYQLQNKNKDFQNLPNSYNALILKLCKYNYENIFVSIDSDKFDLEWLKSLHTQFSVILHRNMRKYKNYLQYTKKVDAFVLITKSARSQAKVLENLRKMVWWHVMTPVFILNIPGNSCEISRGLLHRMWNRNILTSYFICLNINKEIIIYTYNPFSNRAPSQWIKFKGSNNQNTWTMFQRKYVAGNICHNLDFDRTKRLDGYKITVAIPSPDAKFYNSRAKKVSINHILGWDFIRFSKRDKILLEALTTFLNVTLRLYFSFPRCSDVKYQKYTEHYKKDMYANSSADLLFLFQPLQDPDVNKHFSLFERTYPMVLSEIGIVTYNRGYQTLMEKLWNFYGIWTILFTFFILLTTFIVIWFTENKKIAFASFEIIRLLINHTLYTQINTLPLRIFFGTIFIYFIVIQATFNGHLAKFLTKPQLRKHAETLEDVHDLGHTSYDVLAVKQKLAKTFAEKENTSSIARTCFQYILHSDKSAACINGYDELYENAWNNEDLYISKKSFGTFYEQFSVIEQYALRNRIDRMIMILEDVGLRKFSTDKYSHKLSHNDTVAKARLNKDFRPITLENLTFSFIVLAGGLVIAAISFCFEICISRKFMVVVNSKIILQNSVITHFSINTKKFTIKKKTSKRKLVTKKFLTKQLLGPH